MYLTTWPVVKPEPKTAIAVAAVVGGGETVTEGRETYPEPASVIVYPIT